MRTRILGSMAMSLTLAACLSFAASQAPAQAGSDAPQQFTVLRTGSLVAGTESLTNTEAHCSIAGSGGAANMNCRAVGATAKGSYHYNTTLIVDAQGVAYVIACRVPLIDVSCKRLDTGSVLEGNIDKGLLTIPDGGKGRKYFVITSAEVGPLPLREAAPSKAQTQIRSTPPQPVAPASSANNQAPSKTMGKPAEPSTGSAEPCKTSTAACVTFSSEPQGADIYVDGKFAGNTPSMIVLAPGSHELRMTAERFNPWSRTFEASAGSNVTIRATLEAQPQ